MYNVMELVLSETDDFSKDFNYVGKLFAKAMDESLPEEEQKRWQAEYSSAKLCLEQGYQLSYVEL